MNSVTGTSIGLKNGKIVYCIHYGDRMIEVDNETFEKALKLTNNPLPPSESSK